MSSEAPAPDPMLLDGLDRLLAVDPLAAEDAALALDWMVGAGGLAALNQAGLQQFCWYELPFKWLGGPDRHRAILDALARFFDLVGLERYAAVCRSPLTGEVLDAYQHGAVAGHDRFVWAHRASGVVPPDVEVLRWGDLMGPVEFEAFWSSAMTLELAVETGALVPGGRGWRAVQAGLVTAHLQRPRPERFGESLLQEIETERLGAWHDDPLQRARAQLLESVVPRLLAPIPVPRGAGRALAPVRRLLELADAGQAGVTTAGRLTGATVAAVTGDAEPLPEATAPVAAAARRLAIGQRLVRRTGRRLMPTAAGRRAQDRTAELWSSAVEHLAGGAGADPLAVEVVAGLLVAGRVGGPGGAAWTPAALVQPVQIVLTEAGRGSVAGRPVPEADVTAAIDDVVRTASALGAVRADRRPGPDRPIRLTAVGVDLLTAALRRRAVAPRGRADR